LIRVACLQQQDTSVAANGQITSEALTEPEDSLTSEQRAAVFGSTEAAGRQLSPKAKRRAVSAAYSFCS